MALVLPSGVRYTIRATWSNGRPIHTTWHVILTHAGNRQTALAEVGGKIGTEWQNHVLPLLSNNYTLREVAWLDLSDESGTSGVWSLPTPVAGGSPTISLSPYVGIVVSKNITDAGRTRRNGRLFIPGLTGLQLSEDGQISQTALDAANDALDAFRVAVVAYTSPAVALVRLVVAHTPFETRTVTKTKKVPMTEGVMGFSDIETFSPRPTVSGLKQRVETA